MKNTKSRFSIFETAELLSARELTEAEIRIRTHRFETEYKERMKLAVTPTDRAKLQHLLQIKRAQMAAHFVALKLIDEIISKRETNKNVEVVLNDDQEIVFVEEPR